MAKASHWETEKAMETQDNIHKRESEDLRGLYSCVRAVKRRMNSALQKCGCGNFRGRTPELPQFFMLRRETMAQAQIITDPQEKTRLELEQKFAKEHSKASDEELLAYLRQRAQELGRLPEKADITGYQLIKSRFGPWPRVLEKAGLKPPTQRKTMREKREATRRRRKEYKKQEKMKTKERNENEA